jgi:hypothetical protein
MENMRHLSVQVTVVIFFYPCLRKQGIHKTKSPLFWWLGGLNLDSTAGKGKYNSKTYKSFILRVRRNSELAKHMKQHSETAEVSISFLLTQLLCNYFACAFPHREYIRRRVIRTIFKEDDT